MPFTEEDIASLIEALKPVITDVASTAAAAHVTKRNEAFEKKFDSKLETFTSSKPTTQVQDEPEKVTLTNRVVRIEEENKKLHQQIKMERENAQRMSMRSQLESNLQKQNVPNQLLKAAVAQLLHEDKLVDLDENGNSFFKVNSNGYEERASLEEGISSWIKGDGKAFVAPLQIKGTGLKSQRTNRPAPVDQMASQEEKDEALLSLLKGQ